jgi:hypothetical protein
MSYCIVAPTQILNVLDNYGDIGSSHLLLAHDIVKQENQETYRKIFNAEYRASKNLPVNVFENLILDNSVIETGNAADFAMIRQAAEITHPRCIVLPDVLEDADETIVRCTQAADEWNDILDHPNNGWYLRNVPFMYVPQGKTLREFIRAAEALATHPRVKYWGVPRNLVKNIKSRRDAIQFVHALNRQRWIHMMGFSDDLPDDFFCKSLLPVTSIDSAVPLRCTTPFTLESDPGPRGNWWHEAKFTTTMLQNIRDARRLFGA